MNSLLILLFCAGISLAFTALFVAFLALGARRRNQRAHRLGRLLKVSHPEWN